MSDNAGGDNAGGDNAGGDNAGGDNAGGDESAGAFKKAIEKGAEAQRDFIKSYSAVQQDAIHNFFSTLQGLTYYNAMFKTTVQSGGRISIPEAERQALNIGDGDLVQVIIIPIRRKKDTEPG